MPPGIRRHLPTLVVAGIALVYLLLLRGYGFQVEDEGTLLFQLRRALEGQRPYLDFHTGYTPGFFALGTAVMALSDTPLAGMRLALALVNTVAAAGLCEVTRRVAGARLAAIPPLLWLAFMPFYKGEFAAFHVPYPTWPVTVAWIASALVLMSWMERPRIDKMVAAGVLAAATMWMRPNSGAFLLAGSTWIVCAVAVRQSILDRAAAMAASALMGFGIWYTFQFQWSGMDAVVHLLPVLAITVVISGPASPLQNTTAASCAISLMALAAGFLIPTLAWMEPLYRDLGHDRFLFDVLLIGADYQTLYHRAHPPLEPYAAVVVAACALFAAAGRLVARHVLPALVPGVLFVAAGAGLAVTVIAAGIAPEGRAAAVSSQLENASYWLALTANFAALGMLLLMPSAALRSQRARAMVVATLLAVAMYLQMFPRSDFMHQITAAPLTMVVATALLARVARWWSLGLWPRGVDGGRVAALSLWAVCALVLGNELFLNLSGPLTMWTESRPAVVMPSSLPVQVEAQADDELEAIAAIVADLRERTSEGEAVWTFPATSGLLFAAGRANPTAHDYWFPGRPDHAEELRVLEQLRKDPPRYGLTLNTGWTFFEESPAFFSELRKFLVETYALAMRYGRFDLMIRRDLAAPLAAQAVQRAASTEPDMEASEPPQDQPPEVGGDAPAPAPPPPIAVSPSMPTPPPPIAVSPSIAPAPPPQAVIEPDMQARRQAARHWMQIVSPRDAAHASLPEDAADAVRVLRALRDGGDMRGAGWAIAGFASQNPRIRREAADAMLAMEATLRAHKLRLAADYTPALYRPFVQPWVERAHELMEVKLVEPFARAVLELNTVAQLVEDEAPPPPSAPPRHRQSPRR